MYPRLGVAEIVISCIVGLIGIGLSVAMISNKVKSIEELLKID